MKNALVLLVLGFLVFSGARSEVWEVERRWTLADEEAYSEFIKTLPLDVYSSKNSKYYGIEADCADAVYTTRMIFAYENKLPFKIKDPTNSKRYISQSMSRWDDLPYEKRFRKFVYLINTLTSTWSMQFDTYPAKISHQWIRPGTLYLHPKNKSRRLFTYGHAYLVRSKKGSSLFEYMSSTSPRNVKAMTTRFGHTYAPYSTGGGYRLWKQSHLFGADSSEWPGFGMDQFQVARWKEGLKNKTEVGTWQQAVFAKLGQKEPSFEERVAAKVHNLCTLLKDRIWIVQDGWKKAQSLGGRCMNAADEDDFSTPSRDKSIRGEYSDLVKTLEARSWQLSDIESELLGCQLEVKTDTFLNAYELYSKFMNKEVASDPNRPLEERWGLVSWDESKPVCQK